MSNGAFSRTAAQNVAPIPGKCFRSSSSLTTTRVPPLAAKYECPYLSLLIITSAPGNRQNRIDVLSFPAALMCTRREPVVSTLIASKSSISFTPHSPAQMHSPELCPWRTKCPPDEWAGRPGRGSNCEPSRRVHFKFRFWGWGYRGSYRRVDFKFRFWGRGSNCEPRRRVPWCRTWPSIASTTQKCAVLFFILTITVFCFAVPKLRR